MVNFKAKQNCRVFVVMSSKDAESCGVFFISHTEIKNEICLLKDLSNISLFFSFHDPVFDFC